MQITHDNDCEHRLGHDCTCGASSYQFDLAAARTEIERLKHLCDDHASSLIKADAEIERLTKERDEATASVELVNSNNLTLAAELAGWKQTARQMEAERDQALALVAALVTDRTELAQIINSAITPNDAEGHRLLLDGVYHTGPVVDWVHRVMTAMRDLLRKTPAHAKAALEAYGREKVREGMKMAADLIDQNFDRNGWRAHKAILAEMEKEAGE